MLKSQKARVQAWLRLLLMMGFFCNHIPVLGLRFRTYKIGKESLSSLSCTTLPLCVWSMWANITNDRKASWSLLQEWWIGGVWDGSDGDRSLTRRMWWSREWGTFLLSLSGLSVLFPPFPRSAPQGQGPETLRDVKMHLIAPSFPFIPPSGYTVIVMRCDACLSQSLLAFFTKSCILETFLLPYL